MSSKCRFWIPAGLLWAAFGGHVAAQSDPQYIQLAPTTVKGALYRPDSGEVPHVAILTLHRTQTIWVMTVVESCRSEATWCSA